jgi:hypothetical protein
MYWIGLVILGIAVGHEFSLNIGVAVLGAGLMLFPIVRAVLRILLTRK